MKPFTNCLIITCLLNISTLYVYSQKAVTGTKTITSSDLESHVSFLASPFLKGRLNGGEELEIAGQYLATQAKLIGLKPANGNSYFQPYTIIEKLIDPVKTTVQVITGQKDTLKSSLPLYQLLPSGPSDFTIDGDVLFAGYGLKIDKYNYNDFEGVSPEGKILLVMDRAPTSADGKRFLFEGTPWSSFMGIQAKLSTLLFSKAKGILVVVDPKSGFRSFDEQYPGISREYSSSKSLKGENPMIMDFPGMPKIIFIHRSIADELFKGTGHSLEEIQQTIDSELKPHSFQITGKKIFINEVSISKEKVLNNVAGFIEGRDPEIKNEVVIFSSHYDHIGEHGGIINTGADDDASGCAALLSMAEAFQSLEQKPLRSILFLWFSGEEIGLYGSKSYVDNPLFPLKNTIVDLNMDMIGRVRGVADSTSDTPVSGPDTVFVITDNQSKDLLDIANEIDKKSLLSFDYSLSGKDNPLHLFQRSDHFNFVKNDIPVVFFTTGLHADYHTPQDVIEKVDFKKMELITKTMYEIGFTIANKKNRLVVDNPFSSWGKNK
jgi:Zn-dependent M28 family amino/carboxypeptidase